MSTLVRRRLPGSLLLAAAFATAACGTALLSRVAWGRTHAVAALGLFCVLAFVVGSRGRDVRAALAVGPVFWLFLDGFVEHRYGALGWSGGGDAVRLVLLVAAALLPAAVRGAVHTLRRVRRRYRRVGLQVYEPVLPPRRHPSAWN